MRDAGEKLLVMPRLGRDVFARGAPEGMEVIRTPVYEVSLYEMLKAYGDNRRRATASQLTIEASELFSLGDAIERLRGIIGHVGDWTSLSAFLPDGIIGRDRAPVGGRIDIRRQSWLVKEGRANIRQSSAFGPIFVKGKESLQMVEISQEIADSPKVKSAKSWCGSVEESSDTLEADITQEVRIVEALLFAATEPVSTDFLAERLPENADVGAVLDEIQSLYEGRGVNLSRVAGKWSLRTAEDLSPHLRIERKVSRKPSRAAVESLAIIAYHQPVTRSEVEEIRGVSVSKGSFDVLLEAGWIKPVGRRRTPGRPTTWGTTPAFPEEFGLHSLAD